MYHNAVAGILVTVQQIYARAWVVAALLWPVLMFVGSSYLWPGPGLPPAPPQRNTLRRAAPALPATSSRVYISSSQGSLQFWSEPQSAEVHLTIVLPEDGVAPAEPAATDEE